MIFFLLLFFILSTKSAIPNSEKLANHLFNDYNNQVFPVNTTMNVSFQIELESLQEIDTMTGKAILRILIREYWKDQQLVWNSSDYGGLKELIVPSFFEYQYASWIPDIRIYESSELPLKNLNDAGISVSSDGTIYWCRLGVVEMNIQIDLYKYPYDEQTITLTVRSSTYSAEKMDLNFQTAINNETKLPYFVPFKYDALHYKENIGWDILKVETERKYSIIDGRNFTILLYYLYIKRAGRTIRNTLILPAVGISCLAFMYYFLPKGTNERITFLNTLLLTEIMLLVLLTQYMPASKNDPLMESILLLLTISLLVTTGVAIIIDWLWRKRIGAKKIKRKRANEEEDEEEEEEEEINEIEKELEEKVEGGAEDGKISLIFGYTYLGYEPMDQKLKRDLMSTYKRSCFPSNNSIPHLTKIIVGSLLQVDTMSSMALVRITMEEIWEDPRLSWTPASYGNLESTEFPTDPLLPQSIWITDLTIMESAEKPMSGLPYSLARVYYNGTVHWGRMGVVSLSMKLNLYQYPYDKQIVSITIDSWRYNWNFMRMNLMEPAFYKHPIYFSSNIGWDIKSMTSKIESTDYSGVIYRTIWFKIYIARSGKTIRNTLVIPALGIGLLGLFYYFIPRGSGERIQFLTTLLLTEVMLLVILSQYLPISKSNPIIENILVFLNMFMLVNAGIASIIEKISKVIKQKIEKKKEAEKFFEGLEIGSENDTDKKKKNEEVSNSRLKEFFFPSDLNKRIKIIDRNVFIACIISFNAICLGYVINWFSAADS